MQTPNPAAQFPWAEPPRAEHSFDVKQVPLENVVETDEQGWLGNCIMLNKLKAFPSRSPLSLAYFVKFREVMFFVKHNVSINITQDGLIVMLLV